MPISQSDLPSVRVCREMIASAEEVIAHPDEYDAEQRVDAHRKRTRWSTYLAFAERIAVIEAPPVLEEGEILTVDQMGRMVSFVALYDQTPDVQAIQKVLRSHETLRRKWAEAEAKLVGIGEALQARDTWAGDERSVLLNVIEDAEAILRADQ